MKRIMFFLLILSMIYNPSIGQWLPLTGGTITGSLTVNDNFTGTDAYLNRGFFNSISLGSTAYNQKLFVYDDGTDVSGFGQSTSEFRIFAPDNGDNHISFGNYKLGTNTFYERMRLTANGRLGINITNPSALFSLGPNPGQHKLLVYDDGAGYGSGFGQTDSEFRIFAPLQGTNHISFGNYHLQTGEFSEHMRINIDGKVGIGTGTPSEMLSVNGNIKSRKVKVTITEWPDYVFDSSYQLLPIAQVEQYIKTHNHLPGIPSAREVEDKGLDLGDNQAILLKKIEELTLYIIQSQKRITTDEERIKALEQENQQLKEQNKQLSALEERIKKLELKESKTNSARKRDNTN